ncbi:cysteine--1-D-myo-inosityl 2-amino-2-deoxy-alpha-D-glucopyranoside ligase [Brachybacterium huguangmaarense]
MKSWPAPDLPLLPPDPEPVRLHDDRSGEVREVRPLEPGTARLYVCGITPYDSTHLGHAFTYHAADLMRRALLDTGVRVLLAENVTDVDDPLFERADRDGVDWRALAADQSALFAGDMEALRILPPDTYLSVSDAMDEIIGTVDGLVERGAAYQVPSPGAATDDWYQDVDASGRLGDVSGWTREQMAEVFADRGGDPDRAGKRDPFDPLLWRAAREGEPSWDGGPRLGRGRPGWHVECVSIAQEAFGLPFDVQTGGSDLVFPHHDMSASHAAGLGEDFATLYPHAGMVAYQGTKMSKSLGNLVFVSRLVSAGEDPMAIRLVLMDHHYRDDWEWTDAELARGRERLAAYRRAAAAPTAEDAATVASLRAALRDDLDTPRALAVLDAWAERAAEQDPSDEDGPEQDGTAVDRATEAPSDVVRAVDALFGIDLRPTA